MLTLIRGFARNADDLLRYADDFFRHPELIALIILVLEIIDEIKGPLAIVGIAFWVRNSTLEQRHKYAAWGAYFAGGLTGFDWFGYVFSLWYLFLAAIFGFIGVWALKKLTEILESV